MIFVDSSNYCNLEYDRLTRIEETEKREIEKKEIMRNGSGYLDPTAYSAIKKVDKELNGERRFKAFLNIIFSICELTGFHLEDRFVVKDLRTGKIWR